MATTQSNSKSKSKSNKYVPAPTMITPWDYEQLKRIPAGEMVERAVIQICDPPTNEDEEWSYRFEALEESLSWWHDQIETAMLHFAVNAMERKDTKRAQFGMGHMHRYGDISVDIVKITNRIFLMTVLNDAPPQEQEGEDASSQEGEEEAPKEATDDPK